MTTGKYRILIDDESVALLKGYTHYLGTNGYWYISTNKTGPMTVHSIVMGGAIKGFHIDHINVDKNDNRRENLTFVSFTENQVNRKNLNKNNTSGVRGVRYRGDEHAKPWSAQITVNRKNTYLGIFETVEEAASARRAAEVKYFGKECP